jgi:hypothetical protein
MPKTATVSGGFAPAFRSALNVMMPAQSKGAASALLSDSERQPPPPRGQPHIPHSRHRKYPPGSRGFGKPPGRPSDRARSAGSALHPSRPRPAADAPLRHSGAHRIHHATISWPGTRGYCRFGKRPCTAPNRCDTHRTLPRARAPAPPRHRAHLVTNSRAPPAFLYLHIFRSHIFARGRRCSSRFVHL